MALEHKSRFDVVKITNQGERERNVTDRVLEQRAAIVLTVEQAGPVGQNGANAAKPVHLGIK